MNDPNTMCAKTFEYECGGSLSLFQVNLYSITLQHVTSSCFILQSKVPIILERNPNINCLTYEQAFGDNGKEELSYNRKRPDNRPDSEGQLSAVNDSGCEEREEEKIRIEKRTLFERAQKVYSNRAT